MNEESGTKQEENANLIDINQFAALDLRVGQIELAEPIPKSKKLMKLIVDLGALGKRQILAGIAQHKQCEDLVGKQIVVIANLKPAKLMGEESQGMLLAASNADDSELALLKPDIPMPPGARIR